MIEPAHFLAVTAQARCEAGEFELCGCALRPFSFRHDLQLDAIANPLLVGGEVKPEHYFEAAAICSHPNFIGAMPDVTPEDLADFNQAEAETVWRHYLNACYHSRPETKQSAGSSHCVAPMSELVITFIRRHLDYGEEEIWTKPISAVLWTYESLLEQLSGQSRIVTAEEKARVAAMNTAEAEAARTAREASATLIFRHVKSQKEQLELLAKVSDGTLRPDWLKRYRAKRKKGGRHAS